jgi:glycosyltransferase involved in cell wall biosynthesis
MRVLHVIRSVDSTGGGPMEVLRQLAPMYKLSGHDVEVLSLDSPEVSHVMGFPARVHALGPVTSTYGFSRDLLPWLRKNGDKYDAVVVNGIWTYPSFAVWRALRHSKVPYVVFTHGMLDPWFKRTYPMKHLKKWLYWPWAEYRVLRDAKAVLFTSEEERLLARESFPLYSAKEIVVSYGTARPTGESDLQIGAFFERFPHLRGKRLALFMGRVHPKKGCDLAIEAFARVLADSGDWNLVIAGPDQVGWRATLEPMATRLNVSSQITWTGMLRDDLKWGATRAAEVFFLPSHQENFGIAVAEALACGVPTLISNKVNIWREVQTDGAGLVAEDDLKGALSLLRRWVQLPTSCKARMRECARVCFEQRFEIHQVINSLLPILAGAAGK